MLLLLMIIPLLIFGIVVIYLVSIYNGLVSLKNAAAAAWHQIDVQLTRRADLAMNLVETVKGYAAHEKGVFENVAAARSSLLQSRNPVDSGKASTELEGALARLFAVAENYPDLKASANFLTLQSQLQDIENKLASAREYYNETVRRYNTACESFPANAFAVSFGFAPRMYFEAEPTKTEPPRVSFT
jgi:LemA protein